MSEWISVKDKLPKEPGYYLVCWSLPIGPAIDIVYWRGKTWARGNQRITYWMPLPEPPKRSSEDNKHCAIFAATKARAHLIFCNFLAIKLYEGVKIVELQRREDTVLFSNGEEWCAYVPDENYRGRHWNKAVVDNKISQIKIETYIDPARSFHAEDYKILSLPDDYNWFYIACKENAYENN